MPARRHQSAAKLLPTAACFWPPAQAFLPACRHQSAAKPLPDGTNVQPNCCPPLHLFGLPRKYSCSLAGTNL
jgi:hypothetical protein